MKKIFIAVLLILAAALPSLAYQSSGNLQCYLTNDIEGVSADISVYYGSRLLAEYKAVTNSVDRVFTTDLGPITVKYSFRSYSENRIFAHEAIVNVNCSNNPNSPSYIRAYQNNGAYYLEANYPPSSVKFSTFVSL